MTETLNLQGLTLLHSVDKISHKRWFLVVFCPRNNFPTYLESCEHAQAHLRAITNHTASRLLLNAGIVMGIGLF